MTGRDLAQLIYKDFKESNYDQADALLHATYAFRNIKDIKWIKKADCV